MTQSLQSLQEEISVDDVSMFFSVRVEAHFGFGSHGLIRVIRVRYMCCIRSQVFGNFTHIGFRSVSVLGFGPVKTSNIGF